jgi:HEAT repeat protein
MITPSDRWRTLLYNNWESDLLDTISMWISKLNSHDADVQEEAIEQLVVIGEDAIPALIDAVNDGDTLTCAHAIEALGRIGHPSAVGTLIVALQDSEHSIIIAAMAALRRIADPLAVPSLIGFLNADDVYLHFYATHTLSQIDHPEP